MEGGNRILYNTSHKVSKFIEAWIWHTLLQISRDLPVPAFSGPIGKFFQQFFLFSSQSFNTCRPDMCSIALLQVTRKSLKSVSLKDTLGSILGQLLRFPLNVLWTTKG